MTDIKQIDAAEIARLRERATAAGAAPIVFTLLTSLEQSQAALAEAKEDFEAVLDSYVAENQRLSDERDRYQHDRAALSDRLNGTPCAEIRWQHERDDLLARIAALEAENKALRKSLGETLAVATRNEEGAFADRARALLQDKPAAAPRLSVGEK